MLTWREFIALLIAGVWDLVQVGLAAVVVALVAIPVSLPAQQIIQIAGSVVVSLLLAALLGPHWVLLPTFVLENIPGVRLLPTTSAAALYVVARRRKLRVEQLGRGD